MRPYSLPFGGWVYRRGGAGSLEVSRFSLFYTHKLRFYTRFQGVSLRSKLVKLAGPYITRRKQSARQQCPSFSSSRAPSCVPSFVLLLVFSCLPFSCLVFSCSLFLRLPCCLSSFVLCSPVSFCVSFCLLSLLLPVCFFVAALCVFLCASLRVLCSIVPPFLSGRVVGVLSVDVVGLCCSDRVRCCCLGCSVVVFSSVAVYPLFCNL